MLHINGEIGGGVGIFGRVPDPQPFTFLGASAGTGTLDADIRTLEDFLNFSIFKSDSSVPTNIFASSDEAHGSGGGFGDGSFKWFITGEQFLRDVSGALSRAGMASLSFTLVTQQLLAGLMKDVPPTEVNLNNKRFTAEEIERDAKFFVGNSTELKSRLGAAAAALRQKRGATLPADTTIPAPPPRSTGSPGMSTATKAALVGGAALVAIGVSYKLLSRPRQRALGSGNGRKVCIKRPMSRPARFAVGFAGGAAVGALGEIGLRRLRESRGGLINTPAGKDVLGDAGAPLLAAGVVGLFGGAMFALPAPEIPCP